MTTVERLAEHINDMPLLDHHCHPPLRLPQAIDAATLRAAFTESRDPAVVRDDVPETMAYRAMIRRLAPLLAVAPTEEAVLAARARYAPETYHALLAEDAGLGSLYADYFYTAGDSYTPVEWAGLTQRPVYPVVRIETLAERLLPAAESWDDLRQTFAMELVTARAGGCVAFKSIAAYRGGLALKLVDAVNAERAFHRIRSAIEDGTFTRLDDPELISALVWETFEVAAELGLPVQFHVGLGDDDVVLPEANPVLLRAFYREPRYATVPIVLLHCYPFIREAAYLSSIYPNVYTDLGLTIPLAGVAATQIVAEALGIAPAGKVLASTDGHGVPEFQWFAAHHWRHALARALADAVDEDLLDERQALATARAVLHANAEAIYPVDAATAVA